MRFFAYAIMAGFINPSTKIAIFFNFICIFVEN